MVCAERNPNDPQYPRLKPVGVYPVRNGRARIRLAEVAGIQQGYYSPLYITAGAAFQRCYRASQLPVGLPEVALPITETTK